MSRIDWEKFRSKKIGLLGAGKENLSLIPFFVKHGADVVICEQNSEPSNIERLERIEGVGLRIGEDALSELTQFDYVFRTPGMPVIDVERAIGSSQPSPIRSSAVDLFLEYYGKQVIGVTGTKGKGTTSTMIHSILKAGSKKVQLAGNIGNSIFESIDQIDDETWVVMELSSFQLEDISHSPHVAVLLPVTSEHLQPLSARSPNYHRSLEDYIEAKRQLVAFQTADDVVVYAADSPTSTKMAESSKATQYGVGRSAEFAVLTGDELVFQGRKISLAKAGIKGDHLLLDAALAAVTAVQCGIKSEDVIPGLKTFKPLPHRMEKIGVFNGITVINDSYATAPDATIAALSAFDQPTILLAGGSSKGMDFTELAQAIIRRKVKAVLLIGQEAPRIEKSLQEINYSGIVEKLDTLEQAVNRATEIAVSGDTILLSPACASKDMFIDAADRGTQFTLLTRSRLQDVAKR